MKINDYIHINSDAVYNNKEFKLYYDGYLTSVSNNEPITIRYGDQDWKNLKIITMKKDENNKLYANIKLNNFKKMNFCFEYNNVWDNNFSNNYSLKINKMNLKDDIEEKEELNEYLSDDFLFSYNLNKKENIDIPYITSKSEIFENASNIDLIEIELENLEESLKKLFPEEKNNKAKIKKEDIADKFADSFSTHPLYDDNFIKIEYENLNNLEIFKPKQPIRNIMIERFKKLEDVLISNIAIEETNIILKSKFPYKPLLLKTSRENELRKIIKLGNEEDAQFLVVSPYSEVDIYDNSILGTIKRYVAYISKSVRKIYYYLKENLNTNDIQ